MKKSALLSFSVFAVIGLTAFSFRDVELASTPSTNLNLPFELMDDEPAVPFIYDIGPRFKGITKSALQNATSITDIFQNEEIKDIVSYGKVTLVLIEDEQQAEIRAFSEGTTLTEEQRTILKSLDYSANFNLRAECQRYDSFWEEVRLGFHSPHLTIVPEKQASYLDGKEALINYLAEGSEEEKIRAKADIMRPAKLYFTVTKLGTITNVRIGNRSGYETFDATMIELLKNLPGKWIPAENEKGEEIDQELVVSWGFQGC